MTFGARCLWLATAVLAAGCDAPKAATAITPTELTLMTGPPGGAYSPLGTALAKIYNEKIPVTHFVARDADGPAGAGANADAIEAGQADVAFARSDIAYQAYRSHSTPDSSASHLRSVAVLYSNVVHIFVRRGSGITRPEDIRGKRIQTGADPDGSSMTRMVLDAHGVKLSDVVAIPSSRDGITKLKANELDARIFASGYPLTTVDNVGESSEIRLLSMSPAVIDRLRASFPFFKPATIPKGTYPGQDEDVQTIGIDGLLLCRDTLPEPLVYDLTRRLFEALPELSRSQPSARLINAGRAPATPVPLHPGAARYYRERDLFR